VLTGLDRAGRPDEAREHYRLAAARTLSAPEQRYLLDRAAAVRTSPNSPAVAEGPR